MLVENLVDTLRDVVKDFPEIKLLILFGSYANGRAMPASDIDLAVITDNDDILVNFKYAIAKKLKISEDKVSIINLDKASPVLKIKILKNGIVVSGNVNNELIRQLNFEEIIEVIELERTNFYNWLRSKDPIDESLVMSIINQVDSDVKFLNKIVNEKNINDIQNDDILRRAFERALHTAIEGMIDLLRHIVSGLRLGIAEYYKDYIDIAMRNNVISCETGKKLLKYVEPRHKLVHRYRGLDYEELYEKAKELVKLWPQVLIEIRNYLREILNL